MKKILTLALILTLTLSLLTACGGGKNTSSDGNSIASGESSTPEGNGNSSTPSASGDNNSTPDGNESLPTSNEWFSLEKTNFEPGEEIVITTKDITAQMVNKPRADYPGQTEGPLIGLCKAGAESSGSIYYDFVKEGTNKIFRRAPSEKGEYEFRMYYFWEKTVISTLKITVGQATSNTGKFTLDALKNAAKDAGFTVHDNTSILAGWTTKSVSKAEPEGGFQISVKKDGSNFMGISVLKFKTEEIAKEYVAYAATDNAGFDGKIYRSGVFTVDIAGSIVADNEAKLMAALKKAGWE